MLESLLIGLLYILLYAVVASIIVYVIIYCSAGIRLSASRIPSRNCCGRSSLVIVLIMLISLLMGWNPRFRVDAPSGIPSTATSAPA